MEPRRVVGQSLVRNFAGAGPKRSGTKTGRQIVSATNRPPFGSERFQIPLEASGKKWVRLAAWDSAGNGAFTQPVHLK